MADLLAVLYGKVLRVDPSRPDWVDRDRFILSKGHGAAALYAVLAETDFFPTEDLRNFCQDGSLLAGHVNSRGVPGVDVSTGSLGHGLPIACGMALVAKREEKDYRVFVLLGDGELDEGSNWEAILFASQFDLDNLVVIVDVNRLQGMGFTDEVMNLNPLADKWRAFRWGVAEIDGHDYEEIASALQMVPIEPGKPTVLLAYTVKGKAVSSMENKLEWHYRSPSETQLVAALSDVERDL